MKWEFPQKIVRKSSLYAKTFYGMLAFSVGILIIFYCSFNVMITRHHQEQICTSSLERLRLSSSLLDVTFDGLAQNMTQTIWNPDFVYYMINPNRNDQDLNYRISQHLKSIVNSGELLSKAYFYSPFSDLVFQNSNSLQNKQTLMDRDILQTYEQLEVSSVYNDAHTATRPLYVQGRLFVFQELNIATHIGTLAYELDLDQIQSRLFSPREDRDSILVYDQDGQLVFFNGDTAVSILDWGDDSEFITYQNLQEQLDRVNANYYRYDNERGWIFLLPIDTASLRVSWQQVFSAYLPVFLLLICVGFLLSWYITLVIYRPINHLMHVVVPDVSLSRRNGSSEIDILEDAYSSARKEYTQLQGVLGNIAPEILESMLKNLVLGKHLTEERVIEILHGIGDPIKTTGHFFVVACQIITNDGRKIEDTERNLYLLALRNLAGQMSTPKSSIYYIHTDVYAVAFICCFPEDRSLAQVTQDSHQILKVLHFHSNAMPVQLLCARGKIYSNLLDIRYSFHEAMEKVQYQQYLHSTGDKDVAIEEEIEDGEVMIDGKLIKSRAKDIMEQAINHSSAQAQALMDRVLEEINRQTPDDEEYKRLVQMLQDELLERVITYPLTQEDQQLLVQRRSSLSGIVSREDVCLALRDDARDMFRIAVFYSQRSRYKYVEQAKQYIDDNYMDSNLSLNSVGDHVGISASYLSELWSEVNKEKFSFYLSTLRVEKAQQLLSSTKLTIKEIGFRCGFNSAQNFIRVFKKYTGVPPGQFRDNQQ